VIAVEPASGDDTRRSLLSHQRERNVGTPRTVCDAMQAVTPGAVPFEAAEHLISRGIAVDDEAVRRAMRLALRNLRSSWSPVAPMRWQRRSSIELSLPAVHAFSCAVGEASRWRICCG